MTTLEQVEPGLITHSEAHPVYIASIDVTYQVFVGRVPLDEISIELTHCLGEGLAQHTKDAVKRIAASL
ncbi:MAG: hypothetical protein NZM42_11875 [Gemmatales bacterium]|nr:hypothetical protein [Gemmatales bacterium]